MGRWIDGHPDATRLSDELLAPVWTPAPGFRILLLGSAIGAALYVVAVFYTFAAGIGTWGNDIPVGWALGIVHFVWWIGLGHAGTFISAVLLLLEQPWRQSINRIAEAMTLFAVVCAGMYPILHLGRPWFAYWLAPYPSTMQVWPQFRSALVWDALAIATYGTVSLLFWYLGLVPDLAAARDRAPTRTRARVYGLFALGWRGSARHWRVHRVSYGILAGLATPLVVSVHSIIGLDFASGIVPGWHSTILPPYFVVGAIHSGFALVVLLLLALRRLYRLGNVVTDRHLDAIARTLLATGCLMAYCYGTEHFSAWYSGQEAERASVNALRATGRHAWLYWTMLACNVAAPQALWWAGARRSTVVLALVSVAILVGMWIERFLIVVGALEHDRLPSSWGGYAPTVVDGALYVGSLGLFAFLFLLFVRFVPMVPLAEVKELAWEEGRER